MGSRAIFPRWPKNCSAMVPAWAPKGSDANGLPAAPPSTRFMMKKGRSSSAPSISRAMASGAATPLPVNERMAANSSRRSVSIRLPGGSRRRM